MPWEQSWVSERNNFCNFNDFPCCSDIFHQVSVQSDISFREEMSLEEFQDACHSGYLGCPNRMVLVICPDVSYQVLLQSDIWLERCCWKFFEIVAMVTTLVAMGTTLEIRT